ncbi:MAG: hypothetical protein KCHDKBKB_01210 [Elusimicrobia bacterium]|nr:hypothetical protein [Elusimicrobiota bacterium]
MTSVRSRILFFFTLFAMASMFAVYMSSRSTRSIGNVASIVINRHLPMLLALNDMEIAMQKQDNAVNEYLLSSDKLLLDEYEKHRTQFNRSAHEAGKFATEDIEQDKLIEIDELYAQFDGLTRQILMAHKRGTFNSPRIVESKNQFLSRIQTLLDEVQGIRQGMTIVRKEQVRDTLRRYSLVAYGFLGTIALCFLVLWIYLFKTLVQPLSLLLEGIRDFTRGKTEVQIPRIGKDELGELQEAFNEMSREIAVERKKLRNESQSDALTGLFNMRYFRLQMAEEFSRSQRYGRPLTLLMIDVDHFKAYNDRNGHPAGDIVLKEVSRIFIRNVRGTDIVARYGGEEFVVLLPETPLEAGVSVAEKIRRAVEEHYFPFASSQGGQKITVSIGVASYPDIHVTSDQDLIESSDKALYSAKKDGRNRVYISSKTEGNISFAIYQAAEKSLSSKK